MNIDIKDNIITIDTSNIDIPESINNTKFNNDINFLIQKVNQIYTNLYPETELVTVSVLGFNNLEKTRNCLNALIKNTSHIDYRLILVDSGSTEADILGLFKSVEHPKKTIISITKNLGSNYAYSFLLKTFNTRFLSILPNDVICTPNWLDNLLTCIQSDPKIGWATACTTNVSNSQSIDITFDSLDELQEKAREFNVSDPKKWEERMRLINLAPIIRKEVVDNVGGFDFGYFHDFCEDDYCRRVRNLGYKIYVLKDTFLHHDHTYTNMSPESTERYNISLTEGRKNYFKKFHIDAWNSTFNFGLNYTYLLSNVLKEVYDENLIPNILGINVDSGSSILELKNHLRRNNIFNSNIYAYTTNANEYNDLVLVTENPNNVKCGNFLNFNNNFNNNFLNYFDFILLGTPINRIENPIEFLENIINIAKKGSKILIRFENTYNSINILKLMGYNIEPPYAQMSSDSTPDKISSLLVDDFIKILIKFNFNKILTIDELMPNSHISKEILKKHISDDDTIQSLLASYRHFCLVL